MHRREFIGSGGALVALSLMSSTATSATLPASPSTKPSRSSQPVLKLKNIAIGEGQPKVIIPTTASSEKEVLKFVDKVAGREDFHLLELRIDPLDNASDAGAIARLTREVSSRLDNKLLLVTFRTKAEGGKKAIGDKEYAALYRTLLTDGQFDLLDIEMYRDRALTDPLIELAHQNGKHVVLSNHELHSTPSAQEIVSRLREQQQRGADVLKLAAMPEDAADVLTLLNATLEMYQHHAQKPLLTMAMGDLGVLSRISGELSGSALTFGMVGDASASGQIEVADLGHVLEVVHNGMHS
ncbi:type I 3-dehydroquinate dehydratase [Erwinia sp. BNK-24-b]|uniref:type I 3-dehydroquinate dehydratase n=1 Tax=Erwinia TaxID=551 RepID=UPI001FEE183F|nr:type I 3-dehydroquinate dehydratase [Erwinia phyllosphaerae]MBV4365038.1 type I 3-dehydroquinate dehydratase [Erwinia phyllosphaerae]